jgi:hypothetical protein
MMEVVVMREMMILKVRRTMMVMVMTRRRMMNVGKGNPARFVPNTVMWTAMGQGHRRTS